MKRKVVCLVLMFILLATMVVMLTGCGSQNNDIQVKKVEKIQEDANDEGEEEEKEYEDEFKKTEDYKSLVEAINESTKNEEKLDGKTIKNYYNPQTYEILETECKGIISIVVHDFDYDDVEECIIVRVKNNTGIEVAMYKEKDDRIKEVSSVVISEDILKYGDVMNLDVFAKEVYGETKIFVEATQSNTLLSDGIGWLFVELKVNKDNLVIEKNEDIAGSAFMDEQIDEYIDMVKDTGLEASSLSLTYTGKRLVEQNKDLVQICNVKRNHLEGFDVSKYLDSEETRVNYAETTFKNYIVDNELVSK